MKQGFSFELAASQDFEGLHSQARTYLDIPTLVNVFEAFVGLKALFGEPNREYLDTTKSQWTYLLKTDQALVEVYDWKLESWSVAVYEGADNLPRAQAIGTALVDRVLRAAAKQRSTIDRVTAAARAWVIENPFALYYATGVDLLEAARAHTDAWLSNDQATRQAGGLDLRYSFCRAAFIQFIAAVEGLLNVIQEIYLHDALRTDRVAERLAREQIDVRLRLTPLYCSCYSGQPLDHTTSAFKDFMRVVSLRNDFVHANFTHGMRFPQISHEGAVFIVPEKVRGPPELPATYRSIDVEDVEVVRKIVDAIVRQIVDTMKRSHRARFRAILHEDFLGVSRTN